jgi:hypothetical protein
VAAAPAAEVAQATGADLAQATGAATTAADAAAPAVDAATDGAASSATAPPVDPRQPRATVPAAARAMDAATGDAARPSLLTALQHTTEHAAALALGGGVCWGSWALVHGTFAAVLGPEYADGAAVGLIGAELACGHLAAPRLMAGRRDAWTRTLFAFLAAAMACEVVLSFVREDVLHAQHVQQAHQQTAHLAPQPCQVQQPPHEDAPVEDMPADIAASGDRRAMRTWQAGAAQRARDWQTGKAQRDRDWYAAQQQQCDRDAARQRQQQQQDGADLVKAADTHSPAEPYLFALLALVMSGTTAACAAAFAPFVRSLLQIPAALLALATGRLVPAHEPAPEAAEAPAAARPRPTPTGLPLTLPPARESIWRRLAHWPVVRFFTSRQATA